MTITSPLSSPLFTPQVPGPAYLPLLASAGLTGASAGSTVDWAMIVLLLPSTLYPLLCKIVRSMDRLCTLRTVAVQIEPLLPGAPT